MKSHKVFMWLLLLIYDSLSVVDLSLRLVKTCFITTLKLREDALFLLKDLLV